jgi:hypothetical protein
MGDLRVYLWAPTNKLWGSLCTIVSHIKEFQGVQGRAMTARRNREKQHSQGDPHKIFILWSFWPSFWLFPGLPGTPSWDLLYL